MENKLFDYEKYTFDVVDRMFENNYIVDKIQQEPYNDFVTKVRRRWPRDWPSI